MKPRSRSDLETIANSHKWQLNPNDKVVCMILKKANDNKANLGEFYCPCKLQRVPTNICPCHDSQQEIDTTGHCHCNLFYKTIPS